MNVFAIRHRGETLVELRDDQSWVVIDPENQHSPEDDGSGETPPPAERARILITCSTDPTYSVEIDVPDGDVEGLVEVWLGGA